MLAEYFSFGVTEDGKVESLPSLLEGYTPDLCRLPAFLMRVGACVRPVFRLSLRTKYVLTVLVFGF